MQQRFCLCGKEIWVRYLFANMRWRAFFHRGEDGHPRTSVCPNCARRLNIENLR